MKFDFAPRLAELLTNYNVPIKKGEFVVIQGTVECIPLVEEIAKRVLDRGGNPFSQIGMPNFREYYINNATDEQFDFTSPFAELIYGKADVLYTIDAPLHTRSMASVPKDRLVRSQKNGQFIFEMFMKRMGTGEIRWNGSAWPTHASAQEANMSFGAYEKFVYEAYGLHLDDPVAYWHEMRDMQVRYAEWLSDKKHMEVRGPGIELSFDFQQRPWISCHGEVNFPDGEIFTSPIEDSVNGHVEFNYPSFYQGSKVDGVKLVFKDGRAVEASAEIGEDVLLNNLNIDEGARVLGEFAIGTNAYVQEPTGSTLFDEKIGGTIHMALGMSIPDSKGTNKSTIHWDIVHNMREGGEMYADGELFYQNGKFLI